MQNFSNHYQSLSSLPEFQRFLLNANELEDLQNCLEDLDSFLTTLSEAESESSSSSQTLVQFAALEELVKTSARRRTAAVKMLFETTTQRYGKATDSEPLLIACYCDPRFAYFRDIIRDRTWNEVEELVKFRAKPYATPSETLIQSDKFKTVANDGSLISKFLASRSNPNDPTTIDSQIANYKAFVTSNRPSFGSPVDFWRANWAKYPILAKVAAEFLAIPQSSSQVERLFSTCRGLCSSKRNRMHASTLNDILTVVALDELKKDSNICDEEDYDSEGFESSEDMGEGFEHDHNLPNDHLDIQLSVKYKNPKFFTILPLLWILQCRTTHVDKEDDGVG